MELDGASGMKRSLTSPANMRAVARQRMGRIRFPPAKNAVTHGRMEGRGGAVFGQQAAPEAASPVREGAVSRRKWGKDCHCCMNWRAAGCRGASRFRPPSRDRMARRQALPSASSGGFSTRTLCLSHLFSSGTRGKGRTPSSNSFKASPKRVAAFEGGRTFLPGGQASAQNRGLFSAVREVFWEQVIHAICPFLLEAPVLWQRPQK